MNSINFNQAGGFPLTTDILDHQQNTYSSFINALGNVVGNFGIISGCTVTGSNISDGVVCINGEVLDFKGGAIQSTVIIVQETTNLTFQNGDPKPTIKKRYACFGTGTGAINWSEFKRGFQTKDLSETLGTKEDKTTVQVLANRIAALEAKNVPIIKLDSGMYQLARVNGYVDIYPPPGYVMTNLVGFIPSINYIAFNGDVDDNDILHCNYEVWGDRIRVICRNSEQRSNSWVNYLAIWIKY